MIHLLAQSSSSVTQFTTDSGSLDWVKIGSAVWAILLTVVLPLLAKRYSTVAKILKVVVKGVEAGDDDDTKLAIKKASQAAGVEEKLAPIVEKVTGPNGA